MLPEGWKETTLGKCVKIYSGYAPQIVDPKDDGTYPYVKVDDLNNCDKYQKNSKQYFFDEKYCIPLMSVIFPKRGAAIMNNKVRIAATHIGLDTNMMAVYPIGSVCHTEFIYYFIKYSGLYRIADISSIPQINNKHILPYKINLPPLSEQKKIAAILSTWDKAISTADAMLENSHQQKKALMQQLLTGKRRLPGFSGEWELVTLKKLGTTYAGLTGKSKEDFGQGTLFIPYLNVFKNSFVDNTNFEKVIIYDNEKQNCVKYGDILFTISSETPHEVGMSSVFLDHIENVYLNSFCFGFRMKNFSILLPQYARFLFRGNKFRGNIASLAQGATRYNLSKTQFLEIAVLLPPLDEQRAIAAVLDAADREIALLEQKAARLREEKKALMQQLLTGKRRVRV